jgi:hypothetical protein
MGTILELEFGVNPPSGFQLQGSYTKKVTKPKGGYINIKVNVFKKI